MSPFPKAYREAANRRIQPSAVAFDAAAIPETHSMTSFNIRLVERTTTQGSADFKVNAPNARAAATIIAEAHARAQATGSNMVTLPDGQTQVVEAERIVAREASFLLVDAGGNEIRKVPMPEGPSRAQ
jgi:hypothetical protein